MESVSLFSGVGGLEVGLAAAGMDMPSLLCDSWEASRAVLEHRFPSARIEPDVHHIRSVAGTNLLTAGFPCTDLSQAGRTRGLAGDESGLILRVLDLIDEAGSGSPEWVLLENVPNMLYLSGGITIDVITRRLQDAGYRWAYRVIDSRFTGLAQRRRRVFLLASLAEDPAPILLGADAGPPKELPAAEAVGFSWTEGNRGLGWTVGGVPTLRGGSTVQVPSPPAVWLRGREAGAAIVVPSVEACEVLQGFPAGWTETAPQRDRWKLIGNAVSTRVARWIGHQLWRGSRRAVWDESVHEDGRRWPRAARWDGEKRWEVSVSEWPAPAPHGEQQDLALVLQQHGCQPLSYRAAAGFRSRLLASRLQYPAAFLDGLNDHIDHQRAAT